MEDETNFIGIETHCYNRSKTRKILNSNVNIIKIINQYYIHYHGIGAVDFQGWKT